MDSYRFTDRTSVLYSKILEDNSEESDLPKQSKREQPLVQLQVELQNGKKVYLTPHLQDQPFQLASRFCEEHQLDSEMISFLAQSIQRSMEYSQVEEQKKDSKVHILTEPCESFIMEPYPLSCKTTNHNSNNAKRSKRQSQNCLSDLYTKGIKFNQQHLLWIEQRRKDKEKSETKQCTYIPRINQLSKSIANGRSLSRIKAQKQKSTRRQNTQGTEQSSSRCITSSVILTEIARDALVRQRQSCHLKQRDAGHNYSEDVFEALYHNKKGSKVKQSKIIEQSLREETHHPNINPISKEIVGNKSFMQRMVCYQLQRQKKKIKQRNRYQKQNLYKPKTNPGPPNRNCDKLPIGDFLYQNRKKKAPVVVKRAPVPIICQTSKKIYEERKQQAFRRIFCHLAGNGQELVSWQGLKLDSIEQSVLPVLFPLLEEISIMQIDLDYNDFRTALNFLFGTLSPSEKNLLLSFRHQDNLSDHTCIPMPQMNKKSRQLLKHMKRASMNIYDYCELKEALKDEEIESRRISRERIQMEQCTFQPKIDRKPSYF